MRKAERQMEGAGCQVICGAPTVHQTTGLVKANIYSRWNVAESSTEFSAKMALFRLFCLDTRLHSQFCRYLWLYSTD